MSAMNTVRNNVLSTLLSLLAAGILSLVAHAIVMATGLDIVAFFLVPMATIVVVPVCALAMLFTMNTPQGPKVARILTFVASFWVFLAILMLNTHINY